MSKSSASDLAEAMNQFNQLAGRAVRSKLVSETLAEEYKENLNDDDDDLEIPAFLRRTKNTPEQQAVVDGILNRAAEHRKNKPKPAKGSEPEEKPVSEQVLTKAECLSVLNRIQDSGYLQGEIKSLSENTSQYTFIHHKGNPIQVRVDLIGEKYRITGADNILI